jgi:hypothetical protein
MGTAPAVGDPVQIPPHIHPVEVVVVRSTTAPSAATPRPSTQQTVPVAPRSRRPQNHRRCVTTSGRSRSLPPSPCPSAAHTRRGTATTVPAPGHRTSRCWAKTAAPAGTPGTPRPPHHAWARIMAAGTVTMSAVAAGGSEPQAERGSPPFTGVVDRGKGACGFAAAVPCRADQPDRSPWSTRDPGGHAPTGQHHPAQPPPVWPGGQHLSAQPS